MLRTHVITAVTVQVEQTGVEVCPGQRLQLRLSCRNLPQSLHMQGMRKNH